MRDNISNMASTLLGNLALSGTTPSATDWVDVQGFNSLTLEMVNNTITDAGTAAGFTATLQHGDDTTDAGATDCTADDSVTGALTIAVTADGDDNKIAGALGYKGSKRYVRLNVVGTTGTSADVTVTAKQHKANRTPAAYIGTSVAAT